MKPEDLQPIVEWCLEGALAEVEPMVNRFVDENRPVLIDLKDHQWHALRREAVAAHSVQSIQKFLHEQGTRLTGQKWRRQVQLTFADPGTREPLWFALIKLLRWIQQEGSGPQRRIAELLQGSQRGLGTICHDAGVDMNVTPEPGRIELKIAKMMFDRLVARIGREREEVRSP